MAAPSYVSGSTPVATSTTAVVAYPTGLAAHDLISLVVTSDSASIGQPGTSPAGGWTQQGSVVTGGGMSLAVWTATSDGTETGNVTVPITGGTKGVAWMAARRAASSGNILQVTASSGVDSDTTSTAISVTGGTSFTTVTDDLIAFAGIFLAASGGAFSAGISGATITQATMGTYTARTSSRSASNTLFYIGADRPVTSGATAAPAFTATAAGANAAGPGMFLRLHESTFNAPPTANAGADQTNVAPWSTVTVSAGASTDSDGTIAAYQWTQVSGPTVTLSGATTATCTFTAPASMAGATVVLGLVVTDNLGAASTQDTVSIAVNPATEAVLIGGVWTPVRLWVKT